ncbi:MAG: hypothetical protein IJ537_07710 [Bacteroidaceae bacterium]|nr:hypothetical protein [Bacteroidaceae bacterium]MBQ8455205.1 hypothetical protein [Bacteroidaceae bacterium]MBQ9169439.1 hypothetical protein [Bacteroidaceae bacterium]
MKKDYISPIMKVDIAQGDTFVLVLSNAGKVSDLENGVEGDVKEQVGSDDIWGDSEW